MAANHRHGFNTRAISAEALGTSGRNIRQKRLMTASKDAVSNGNVVASPVRNVTFRRPSRFAFRSATANISPARSIPVTEPEAPTVCAARIAG
jgi:hypothetical protein